MAENIELNFKIQTQGQNELDKVAQAVGGIANSAKLTNNDLNLLDKSLQSMVGSGQTYRQALEDISKSEGSFGKVVSETAKELLNQEKALEKAGQAAVDSAKKYANTAGELKTAITGTLAALAEASNGAVAALGPVGAGLSALGIVAGVAGRAIWGLARSAGELAEQQINTAQRTGLTVKEVGLFSQAAEDAQVNAQAFTTAMRTLSQGLSENSDEGKKAKQALSDIGIAVRNDFGGLKSTGELYTEIADKLGAIEDPAKRARTATSIFGRAGLELLPLLNKEFRSTIEELKRMGVGFDEDGAKTAKKFDDAVDKLTAKVKALTRALSEVSADAILGLIDRDYAKQNLDKIAEQGKRWREREQEYIRDKRIIRAGGLLPMPALDTGRYLPKAPTTQDLNSSLELGKMQRINGLLAEGVGLSGKLKQAEEDLGKAVRDNDPEKVRNAQALIKSIQGQIKSSAELKSAQEAVEKLLQQAQLSELTGLGKINAERAITIQQLGKTEGMIDKINQTFNIYQRRELDRIKDAAQKERQDYLDQADKDRAASDKFSAKQFSSSLKKPIAENERDVRRMLQTLDLYDKSDRDKVLREANRSMRIAELTAGPGGEVKAVEDSYQKRLDLAGQLFDIERRKADRIVDTEEKQKSLAQARYDYEKQIDDARMDRELKLLELRKRALDEYRDMAGRVFDALMQRGSGGLRDFFGGQLKTMERQIFVNASGTFFQQAGSMLGGVIPGQRSSDGSPTLLGTLLAGTIFDPKNKTLETATVTTAKETKRTADEVKALRMTISGGGTVGTPPGGDFVPGLLGVTYNDLARFGSDTNGITGSGGIARILGVGTTAKSQSSTSQFLSGMFGGVTSGNPLGAIFTPSGQSVQLGDGRAGTFTTAQRWGTAMGTAATLAGGAFGVYSGIQQGGARGTATAIGSAAGTAAMLDPEPISKAVLMGVSIVSGAIGAIFGNSREKRIEDLTKELNLAHYTRPMAISATSDVMGGFVDYDSRGMARRSNLSPFASVDQPFVDRWNGGFINVPGAVTGQYRGAGMQAPNVSINMQVQAWDTDSFRKYGPEIAKSLHQAINAGQADVLMDTMKQRVRPQ